MGDGFTGHQKARTGSTDGETDVNLCCESFAAVITTRCWFSTSSYVLSYDMLPVDEVLAEIAPCRERQPSIHIVVTAATLRKGAIEAADLVTK
jgi:hypothetical protein